jgi:prepilin-type N-terminal cleavage/methylation domain-containing protein
MMKKCRALMQKGYTLIEIIVVIIISSIILFAGIRFFELAYLLYNNQKTVFDIEWQGRLATNMIKMDIQMIRSTTDITSATATDLAFTDEFGTSVAYQVSGTQLQRNSQVLANDVQSIAFSYYNSTGTLLTFPVTNTAIRFIAVQLNVSRSNTAAFTYMTGAALWNIM